MFQTGLSCLKLRDDVSRDELMLFEQQLRPAIECAPSAVKQNELLQIPEGRLGIFFNDLVPKDILQAAIRSRGGDVTSDGSVSLAQRLKNMSNIPLFKKEKDASAIDKEDGGSSDGEQDEEPEDENRDNEGKDALIGGVIDVIAQQEEEDR